MHTDFEFRTNINSIRVYINRDLSWKLTRAEVRQWLYEHGLNMYHMMGFDPVHYDYLEFYNEELAVMFKLRFNL